MSPGHADEVCPLLDWAGSGLMPLTGRVDGPPLAPDVAVVSRLQAMLADRAAPNEPAVDLRQLLSGRAAAAGFTRQGERSANGFCRLVRAADGWLSVNLARESDVELLGALVGRTGPAAASNADQTEWALQAIAGQPTATVLERAELLGLPLSALAEPGATVRPPIVSSPRGEATLARDPGAVTVVNLAALWAGPLVARLLSDDGAQVITAQSSRRLDPSKESQPVFHRWLHRDQAERQFDFAEAGGRAELAQLIRGADVVIEGSRPRALQQLGLGPTELRPRPGQVWLSITGYGRDSGRVAFGDDAAVAGGLVARDRRGPVFAGDALADPVTGVFGYRAVRDALAIGGGQLIDLSMSAAVASLVHRPAAEPARTCGEHEVSYSAADQGWWARCGDRLVKVAEPVPFGMPPA